MTDRTRPKLYLNHLSEYDWLIALEFGSVDDGQPAENWRGVSSEFGYLHDGPDGRALGFKVVDFSVFDPTHSAVKEIWQAPRFDAPALGLTDATAGEIVTSAGVLLDGRGTINRDYFQAALAAEGEEALELWRGCLMAGDSMAHFALGYTLFELGRFHEAYRHLRHYTEIAPRHSWNWCWLAKAAEAIGETAEARVACARALELSADGDMDTDADEILARLDGR